MYPVRAIEYRPTSVLVAILLFGSLLLAACGDETPTPRIEKEMPRDRALYLGNVDGWPDLYTVNFDGKATGRLTESAEAEFGATWSPDGRRIAYTALNGDQAAGDYYKGPQVVTIDADGKNRKVVATDAFNPQWSPDGSKILVTRLSPTTKVPAATAEATPTPLVPRPFRSSGDSAEAQKLKASLYVVQADGSNSKNPLLLMESGLYGDWSPDGRRIAYVGGSGDIDKPRSLHVANSDGSGKVNLSEKVKLTGQDILFVKWSPDGLTLAFTAIDAQRDKAALWKVSPEGNTPRRITDYNGSGNDFYTLTWSYADYYNPAPRMRLAPVWSPNSRLLTFADGSSRVAVSEADTGNTRFFTVGNASVGQDKDAVMGVSWLNDNRRLLVERASAGRNALVGQANNYIFDWFDETLEVLDISTKGTTPLGNGHAFFASTCCGFDTLNMGAANASPTTRPAPSLPQIAGATPEGKLVLIGGIGTRYLSVVDLDKGQRYPISSGAFRGLDVSISPDGKRLVFIEVGDQYNSTIYLSGIDGKQRLKLSEGVGEPDDLTQVVRWSPDGKMLAFQALGSDKTLKPGLYVVSLDQTGAETPAPRLITSEAVTAFDWSPDSRSIAFKLDGNQYELYTVQVDNPQSTTKLLSRLGSVNRNFSSLNKGLIWSPDGSTIALAGLGTFSRYAIWLVTPDGKTREIASTSAIRLINGFTTDGSRLLITTANYNQTTDIQMLTLSSGNWRSYGPGSSPQIDSSGQYVAVFSRHDNTRYGSGDTSILQRMTVIKLATGQQSDTELLYPPYYSFRARFFDWSPNQPILAYYENNTIWGIGPDMKNTSPIARAMGLERLIWVK
jgi:Tol biopolymer transport system component